MDIKGYQLLRTIGRGGMATVYLAVQESLGREIVLKTLNRRRLKAGDFVDRFINEGRLVAGLTHPHIITIHDVGESKEAVYISMEYLEGGDLKSRLEKPMTPAQALDILIPLTEALRYAHDRDVVHRDVKPANVLFRTDGTPIQSDFGIAKETRIDRELTATGTILGSPYYMAPEQAEGRPVDGRADLYSIGIIAHEMLTGARPFNGQTAVEVIMQQLRKPPPPLPSQHSKFQPLLDSLLAKRPQERMGSAKTLLEELRALRADYDSSGSPHPGRGGRHPAGVWRAALLGGGLVGAAAIAGGVWFYANSLGTSSLAPPTASAAEPIVAPVIAGAAPTAEPARPDGNVSRDDAIKALAWLGRHSIEEGRLTHPPAENAYYYYSRLIALDPTNAVAKQGFKDIAERFVVLAEQRFAEREYGKAQAYIALGLQVDPSNAGLKSLESFIERRERGWLERLKEYWDN